MDAAIAYIQSRILISSSSVYVLYSSFQISLVFSKEILPVKNSFSFSGCFGFSLMIRVPIFCVENTNLFSLYRPLSVFGYFGRCWAANVQTFPCWYGLGCFGHILRLSRSFRLAQLVVDDTHLFQRKSLPAYLANIFHERLQPAFQSAVGDVIYCSELLVVERFYFVLHEGLLFHRCNCLSRCRVVGKFQRG